MQDRRPDPYEVLGISADASTEEVSRAYRRLARTLHPDSRPGQAGAADQFRAVSEAYELLSDPVRRMSYDQHRREVPVSRHQPQAPRPGGRRQAAAGPPLWAGPVRIEPLPGQAAPQPDAGTEPALPTEIARWFLARSAWPW